MEQTKGYKCSNVYCGSCVGKSLCGEPEDTALLCPERIISVPTNADRIRAMSDKELAQFLDDTQRMECESLHILESDGTLRFESLKNGWLIWLQQPVKEGD